ncbi:hypothetical protein KC341_g24 [Hortaea werneckii]|nr:hypothetical protein KC341_g24 [Hortaea werneckii]
MSLSTRTIKKITTCTSCAEAAASLSRRAWQSLFRGEMSFCGHAACMRVWFEDPESGSECPAGYVPLAPRSSIIVVYGALMIGMTCRSEEL